MRLNGKVAVVTGAGSGFGEGIARRFAGEGAKVIVADIDDRGVGHAELARCRPDHPQPGARTALRAQRAGAGPF